MIQQSLGLLFYLKKPARFVKKRCYYLPAHSRKICLSRVRYTGQYEFWLKNVRKWTTIPIWIGKK